MVLVTGASGFLGQHLVRHLSAAGAQVRALYNNHPPSTELQRLPGIQWCKYDLLDVYDVEEMMQDINDIYHCAAIVSFNPRRRAEMLHFNAESTANIVNQSVEQGIRKMIYVSSVAALGRAQEGNKEITEDEEWEESKRNSVYGLSKYMAEIEVWRGIGEGLDAVIVNPGIMLGSGDWDEGSPRLIKTVNDEFPFYTKGVTSWVDVLDVVRCMKMLMDSGITAERFILSAGNFAFKDIFTMMAGALNKKPPHIKAGAFMTGLVWRASALKSKFTGKGTPITKETALTAQSFSYYDNGKLLKALSAFVYTPIQQTIQAMAQSFMLDIEQGGKTAN